MSKKLLLSLALLLVSVTIFAQKKIKSGAVKYKVVEVQGTQPETKVLEGLEMTLYFTKNKSKMEMSLMGGLINMATITDHSAKESVALLNLMGQKVKTVDTLTNYIPQHELVYNKDKKEKILDYSCYAGHFKNKKGADISAFITDKIEITHPYLQQIFGNIEGFPLEYTINNNGTKMTFRATRIDSKIDKETVFLIPEEYIEKTPAQIKEELGFLNFGF